MNRELPPTLGFPAPSEPYRDLWDRRRLPEPEPEPEPRSGGIGRNILLFVATVICVFKAGAQLNGVASNHVAMLLVGWNFAVPFLGILIVHEFGHYIAARVHRVDASLPYFLPFFPSLSPFGTLGAIISMRERIRSRAALLDIGASGPLAGLVVAIPVLAYGLSLSTVTPVTTEHHMQEGQSLLYMLLKRVVLGPIPDGMDVNLHPTAFAGWGGLLITMLNLLPWGQLDGGHVAYALLGRRQHALARWFRRSLLLMFIYVATTSMLPVLHAYSPMKMTMAFMNSCFWLVWYVILGILGRVSGGAEHPETEPGPLSPVRKVVAVVTLAFFVLLFMPVPLAQY
ncbi:MAG TPA: site-2 protease family protein [Polyangiaceae bacterium]|nr:site-2 protease family protein [Polyangiaceae bacterium]